MITLLELLGGLALILGLGTRIVTPLLAMDNLVALLLVHLPNGFFVSDGGYELVLLLFAANVFFTLAGVGQFSVDAQLANRSPGRVASAQA